MSEQRAAGGGRPAEADVESGPAGDGEAVDGEVVEAEIIEEPGDAGSEGDEVAAELDELAEVQRERDSYLELAQRARADFENYRRRVAGQAAEAERRGRASVARDLLPAIDNLERALAASEGSAEDGLASGVRLVLDELRDALERSGVSSYDPVGERFDPTLHEAISTGEAAGAESGVVLETLERGYRVDEHVIRPARVVVSG